ncbi:MAG: dihydroorotate dehydrogenase [Clostridiales bacterium]|jgi:dihydroorotate dehydrogenase (NAD+) catalytic subunit|nr:dihydroorotate dehydrogenase [Clostridiales bacterium]
MINLSVKLNDWTLKNPVIPASGTFGYGLEFSMLYDLNVLGAFSTKGTTWEPRVGNPLPRIAETASGMLNAVGLQNPGAQAVKSLYFPAIRRVFSDKLIVNVGGHDEESYIKAVELLSDDPIVGAVELNISCPNVKAGGMAIGTDAGLAAGLTAAVKKVCRCQLIVKLSPNVTDIAAIARAAEDAGADGISLINTLLGMAVDYRTGRPIIANTYAGHSGGAIKPVALRMVHQVAKAVKIPVIGMGGVETAEDVIEFMSVGATAVMVGSKNLTDPFVCKKIIERLPSVLQELGTDDINTVRGRAL